MSETTKYPECDKWGAVHDHASAIMQFIDWADYTYGDGYRPPLQDQIYAYYEIDAKKLEEERRAMIDALQG